MKALIKMGVRGFRPLLARPVYLTARRGFTSETKPVSYTFNAEDIKGTTRGKGGLLLMAFTCTKCETKQARTFSKDSYT